MGVRRTPIQIYDLRLTNNRLKHTPADYPASIFLSPISLNPDSEVNSASPGRPENSRGQAQKEPWKACASS
jgi:hypothetical protein